VSASRTPSPVGRRDGFVSRALVLALLAVVTALLAGCLRGPVAANTPASPVRKTQQREETSSVPPEFAGKVTPPAAGAYLGVYRPPAPFEMSAFDSYVSGISKKSPAILMWYQQWALDAPREFDPAACVSVYQRGAVPMITWEPWDSGTNANNLTDPANQPQFRLSRIDDGSYDTYIRRFATRVASVRGPVMIRLMHEMNGQWYPWGGTVNGNTPALYVKTWRRIHTIFDQQGATNVTWVWSINHESVPNSYQNRYAAYYPGDAYVDWTSVSGFNWGTASPYSTWRTFDHWYTAPLAYLKGVHKPIVIAEFASVEQGGDKAAWIADAYAKVRKNHPEVKAIVYYDSREAGQNGVQNWRIDTSSASLDAYRTAVAEPYFLAGPTATLDAWTKSLTNENWVYLRSLLPVY
jgi:mannan endo-1,4-beta-mannosidase